MRFASRNLEHLFAVFFDMKTKLDAYKGRLDATQIAAGMNAARQNAQRLADDARMLLEACRYPSAASLAILSIEEAGKVSILRRLAVAKDDAEAVSCWRDYRSHTKKTSCGSYRNC